MKALRLILLCLLFFSIAGCSESLDEIKPDEEVRFGGDDDDCKGSCN